MDFKNGEVNWTDPSFDGGGKKNNKDLWLRLAPGSNVVRLLTLPHQYGQHKYSPPGGRKFGYRINCSGKNGACPVCEKGDRAKRRWFIGVIDRKTNTFKVLDIGYQVFKSISTLAKDDDWGNPSNYDLDIVVDPNGGPSGYYSVVAKPPKPLSANDLMLRDENGTTEVVRLSTPPTPEKVQERLTAIMEEINASGEVADSTEEVEEGEDTDNNFFKEFTPKG